MKKISAVQASVLSLTIALSPFSLEAKDAKTLSNVVVTASADENGNVEGYKTGSSISSTRTNTPLIDTPQAVAVVTQDQILDQNITKMEEAARYVPGVNVQMGEGHRDQVTIRGMTNGSNGTTSNFFIDGARDDVEYVRDFYNTDRIEFLKGPNAMAFGRGSPGGVINRVAKYADGTRKRRLVLTGGSFDNRRAEADIGDRVNEKVSLRLNTMYQKSNSYRDHAQFERYGINPTATIDLTNRTELQLGYEHFDDQRFNDRGIPSQNGTAYKTKPSTFFGNPNANRSNTRINSVYGILTHDFDSTLQLKNHTRFSRNHKYYQNASPNSAAGTTDVQLKAYGAESNRENFTNQTDIIKKFETGSMKHKALFGTEITRQDSTRVRNNGIFSSSGTNTTTVSLSNPLNFDSVTYDDITNNNRSEVRVYGVYLQDQIEVNKYLQLTAGIRFDRFEIDFKDKLNSQNFKRVDNLYSPRAGVVVKPQKNLSLYGSYGVTYVPNSGDQFDSLNFTSSILKPEEIQNYEIGAKWDPTETINLSVALFQLDRSNTPATDPNGSGYSVLTGESRTRGIEFAATGKLTDKWQLIAGYAYQDAEITSTSAASSSVDYKAGTSVALVPHNTFSLWNKYDFNQNFAAGLGVVSQSNQFAGADNTVRLKGFTRFDAALYYRINSSYRVQVNVENVFDRGYIQTAHNNNNILPGSPRAFRASLIADF